MHDGKMLCMLTQNSLWNRRFYPFLLCKCQWGDGVKNDDHECVQFTHEEQVYFYERSNKRWDRQREKIGDEYSLSKHNDWIDEHNFGISHHGLHSSELHRGNIRFDIFHMKCSITKNLMTYLRTFILCQMTHSIQKFSKLLSNFWGEFHIFVWMNNKPFNSFQGNELAQFVTNIPTIILFMRTEFVETEHLQNLIEMLKLWQCIPKFHGICNIENVEWYNSELEAFENNVKCFYKVGSKTFLTNHQIGDLETFYLHVLRFYIPNIAKITLQQNKLGIGVFAMQGYEWRNK